MQTLHILVIDVFDPKSELGMRAPIVRHEFPGITREDSEEHLQMHLEGDAILRGCLRGERDCVAEMGWDTMEVPDA